MKRRSKWDECKKAVNDSYSSIYKQWDNLQKELPNEIKKNYLGRLLTQDEIEEYLGAASSDLFYRTMNLFLNDLASKFDKKTNSVRFDKAETEKCNYIGAKHTFLACNHEKQIEERLSNPVTASMYCIALPPDERLIQIKIDKHRSHKSPLLSTLHEVGHYLGSRYRIKRYRDYFLPLVLNAFFYQIYHEACCCYSGLDDQDYYAFDRNSFLTPDAEDFAEKAQKILNNVQSDMGSVFFESCKKYIDDLEIDKTETPKEATEVPMREILATKQCYFKNIRSILLISLCDITNSDKIKKYIDDAITRVNKDVKTKEYVEKCIKAGFDKVKKELNNCIENGIIPEWYESCERLLDEPVADIFMLKISRISARKYIDHMLCLYQKLIIQRFKNDCSYAKVGKTTALLNEITKTEKAIRILSVLLAREESITCFWRPFDWFVKYIPFEARVKQRYEARKTLALLFDTAKTNATPAEKLVCEYVKVVWDDKRYNDVFQSIQKEWRKNNIIINILKLLP